MNNLFKLPTLLILGSSTVMVFSFQNCSKLPSSQQASQSDQSSQATVNLSQAPSVTVKSDGAEGTSRPPVKRQEKLTRIVFGKLSDIYIDTNNDQLLPPDGAYPYDVSDYWQNYYQPARDFTLEVSTGNVYATDSYEKLYKLTVSERLQLIRLFKGVSIQTFDYIPECAAPPIAPGAPGSYAQIQLSSGAAYDLASYCVSYRILDSNGNDLDIRKFTEALSKKVLEQLGNDIPYPPQPVPLQAGQ